MYGTYFLKGGHGDMFVLTCGVSINVLYIWPLYCKGLFYVNWSLYRSFGKTTVTRLLIMKSNRIALPELRNCKIFRASRGRASSQPGGRTTSYLLPPEMPVPLASSAAIPLSSCSVKSLVPFLLLILVYCSTRLICSLAYPCAWCFRTDKC